MKQRLCHVRKPTTQTVHLVSLNVGDSDVNSSDKDERDPDSMLCLLLGRPHGEPFGPGFGSNIQTVQTDFLKLIMVAGHG